MNTKIILLLSDIRSGSTYFNKFFINFNNIDIEFEIFNSNATGLSSKLNNKYLHDLMVVKYGINYKSIVKSKFVEILIYLSNNCNKEFLIFKCFLSHLNSKQIKYLLDNKIIYHTFILERKNIIDRYISYKKVKITHSWIGNDTSNIQINFNIAEYKNFLKKNIEIYKTFFDLVKNTEYTYFEYNNVIKINNFINKIQEILPKLQLNRELTEIKIVKKQDNQINYIKKIKNYNKIKNYFENELNKYI